jgi:hypothetical protein
VVWADGFRQRPLQTGKQQGQKKVTTYFGRNVFQTMWALNSLMPKSGLFTGVDASDAEGEF